MFLFSVLSALVRANQIVELLEFWHVHIKATPNEPFN
jgi:hypothetical protein